MPIILRFSRYTERAYTVFACVERSLFDTHALGLHDPKAAKGLSEIMKAPKRYINKLLFLPMDEKQSGTLHALVQSPHSIKVLNSGYDPGLNNLVSKSSCFLLKAGIYISPFSRIVQNRFMALGQGPLMSLAISSQSIFNTDLPFKNNIR